MKKLAVLTLLVLLVNVAIALPIQADAPVRGEASETMDYMVVDCAEHGYDFEIWDRGPVQYRWNDYFDEDDQLYREIFHLAQLGRVRMVFTDGQFSFRADASTIDAPAF